MKFSLKTSLIDDTKLSIDVLKIGQEFCDPRKKAEDYKNSRYTILFVLYGRGYVVDETGKEYTIRRNEAFVLYKDERYCYKPDKRDPWSYIWVDFDGEEVDGLLSICGFSRDNIKKHINSDFAKYVELMKKMYLSYDASEYQQMRCTAYFMLVLSKLIEQENEKHSNVKDIYKKKTLREILIYINNNYALPTMSASKVCEICGISSSAIERLFSEFLGMSPIDYINSYRISVACDQMNTYDFDIASAAQWVGYTDLKYFSRVFKEKKGMTPSEYKAQNKEDDPFAWIKAKGLFFR